MVGFVPVCEQMSGVVASSNHPNQPQQAQQKEENANSTDNRIFATLIEETLGENDADMLQRLQTTLFRHMKEPEYNPDVHRHVWGLVRSLRMLMKEKQHDPDDIHSYFEMTRIEALVPGASKLVSSFLPRQRTNCVDIGFQYVWMDPRTGRFSAACSASPIHSGADPAQLFPNRQEREIHKRQNEQLVGFIVARLHRTRQNPIILPLVSFNNADGILCGALGILRDYKMRLHCILLELDYPMI